jgi:hypothetical protein
LNGKFVVKDVNRILKKIWVVVSKVLLWLCDEHWLHNKTVSLNKNECGLLRKSPLQGHVMCMVLLI